MTCRASAAWDLIIFLSSDYLLAVQHVPNFVQYKHIRILKTSEYYIRYFIIANHQASVVLTAAEICVRMGLGDYVLSCCPQL